VTCDERVELAENPFAPARFGKECLYPGLDLFDAVKEARYADAQLVV
jgi:hypothetical protein